MRPVISAQRTVAIVSFIVVVQFACVAESSAQHEPPGADHTDVEYRPPVDRPVVDPFRKPRRPWLPGNRGLEYDTRAGDPIRAIGAGTVVYAGVIAGERHLTILHPDGLRSSYSRLRSIIVTSGSWIGLGTVVGTAGERFHLGVRAGSRYIDPGSLFVAEVTKPILVPSSRIRSRAGWIDSGHRPDRPHPQRVAPIRGAH